MTTFPQDAVVRVAPLTVGQTRLWFADRMDPGDPAYNMPIVRRLTGLLDAEAMRRAFAASVRQHEILRTVYQDGPDGPVQNVLPYQGFEISHSDLTEVPEAQRMEQADALLRARSNQRFDLERGPVLDVCLIRLAAQDHLLCVVLHHIAGDGWSLGVLFREAEEAYAAYVAGLEPQLPPRSLQYADVAERQLDRLASADAKAAVAYWAERLGDCPVLELPTDRPRPAVRGSAGAALTLTLDAALAARIARLAKDQRVTPFMTMLTAFEILLARHSGQQEVTVGSPVAGRASVEFEDMIGYFVDTVVLRADLRDDPTFRVLLRRTRADALGAFTHAEVPYERLLEELEVPRDLSRTALYQAMFALHTQENVKAALFTGFSGLQSVIHDPSFEQSKADLLFDAWPHEHGIECRFTYSTELFDASTVERLARRFRTLLEAVTEDPDYPVSQIPLSTPDEGRLIERAARGESPATPAPLVPAAIAAAAAQHPDQCALSWAGGSLKYAELLTRVEALAARLAAAGAGPEKVVALALPKGPNLIISMLAAWRAGAAYLPLDPAAPTVRNLTILAACAPAVIAAEPSFPGLDRLDEYEVECSVLMVGDVSADTPIDGLSQLPDSLDADSLAYVIYTSGSTGAPKGVLITHRALAARVEWMRESYRLTPQDRVLQFSAVTFDTHVEEIFPTLASGATLVLPGEQGALLPDFLATPDADGLTVLDLPTAYWHELVAEADEIRWPDTLRLVILGGDQASGAAVGAWRERFGDQIETVNTYGPTEAAVIATAARLGAADAAGRPSIGGPIGRTTARVLDAALEPVPVGVPGELYLGGDGLARGYLGAPGATADRFIPDPFGTPGSRLYRTGDRVVLRSDGTLVFLGRGDHQVKIRGFRVEPAEVEARLAAHRRLSGAVVLVRGEATERHLVAYVVPKPGAEPTAEELRDYIGAALPAYFVPAAIMVLPKFPLNAHGKIDTAALPVPPRPDAVTAEYVPCESLAEQLVAEVFAGLFELDQVGALDDFFDLGGHSLLAMKVVGRLRVASGVALPIKALFADSTVRGIAAELERLLEQEIDALTDEEVLGELAGQEGQ
ncbi:non-ribosomal peptide synthetase [Actinospica robiniae]|uniref:non-ribosomal peptide synthetase n=1 Tax=Actinospica robiniae TaxID=304901 RepID=UPI000420CD24|nr:non-ribosomal peptide synthetase [Actinospica robiniae]